MSAYRDEMDVACILFSCLDVELECDEGWEEKISVADLLLEKGVVRVERCLILGFVGF